MRGARVDGVPDRFIVQLDCRVCAAMGELEQEQCLGPYVRPMDSCLLIYCVKTMV